MAEDGNGTVGTTDDASLGIPSDAVASQPSAEPVAKETTVEPTTPNSTVEQPVKDYETENARLRAGQATYEKKLRDLSKKLSDYEGQKLVGNNPENLEMIFGHPMVQNLIQQNAEFQLKSGVKEILEKYPNTPEAVVKAIISNPRGFVKPETETVDEGLWDIEDYLASLSENPVSSPKVEAPTGKEFPVAKVNPVTPASSGDVITDEIIGEISRGPKGINDVMMAVEDGKYKKEQVDKAFAEYERRQQV
jgi:hypothetical protein